MHVVDESPERVVGWLASGTEISYWATADGADPRTVPLAERFRQELGTAVRRWEGNGVLRVIPLGECWQVIHFWDAAGEFLCWYVNLESRKRVLGHAVESVDWHLDLLISPEFEVDWKDRDEAAAALGTPYLRDDDFQAAQAVGESIAANPREFIDAVGDWRDFRAPDEWGPLDLPRGWRV
jgi:hypothetical protein